jgi:hypothetical protein
MNKIGEFNCILNEKHWDVVADEIPVALAGAVTAKHVSRLGSFVGGG